MMRHGADHLVVKSGDQIIGAVGVRDIMVSQGVSPLFLLREMASQETVEGLAATCAKIPHVIQLLVEGGAKAWDAAAAAAALEKAAMSRILGILTRGLGKPAAPFAVVAFGRQGRREQVFPEAQRNGIMFAPVDDESERETQRFLDELGPMIVEALVLCGYPEGAGDMTCARAKWRATIREWEKRYDGWMSGPVPENAHRNLEFFDALPLYGEDRAVKALLRRVRKRTGARPLFELHLACECLSKRPPLTFLRDSVINKSGEKFPRLDLRAQLIDPIVRFARLWAMRHEIGETNTVMRLSRLADQGFIPRDLFADLKDSFEFASRLMLIHQLEHARKGLIPDSFIRPSILSDIEKRTLKEAFRVMDRMLSFIKHTLRSAVYADSR
jgi:CBS domain-containing protein